MQDGTAPAPTSGASTHRPHLDGLRGVAVLLVLGFHANLVTVPGGFLGIDLFFVLSGFLITTLLVGYFVPTGAMGFRRFWSRRFRRLVPALLLMIVGLVALAAAFPRDPSLAALRTDGLATVAFVANWRFVVTGQSYFANFAPSALRHTWSLGVEEQWYLLWPVLLLGLIHLTKGRLTWMFGLVTAAALASAAEMGWVARSGSTAALSRAYYGTDTRAQALLVGSALAFALWNRPSLGRRPAALLNGLGAAATIGFGVLVWRVHEQDLWLYHGGFLLAALLGALMVGAAARTTGGPLGWLWGQRWLRYVGCISYGLYLFHWPIDLFLTQARVGFGGIPLKAVQFVLTLSIAALSSALIELPIRQGVRLRVRPVAVSMASIAIAVSLLLLVSVGTVAPDLPAASAGTVVAPPASPASTHVLVVGDSVAWDLSGTAPLDARVQVDAAWHVQCDVVGDTIFIGREVNRAIAGCSSWPGEWVAAANRHPDAVLVVLGLRQLFDPLVDGRRLTLGSRAWETYYRGRVQYAISLLRRHTRAPIVFFDVPCYSWPAHPEEGETGDPARLRVVNRALQSVVAANPGVSIVDYASQVCAGPGGTRNIAGRRPDGAHPTPEFAQQLWRWLAPALHRVAPPRPTGPGG